MRVIAGRFRSRKLEAPPGVATRPTSDRLRETLFNVLAPSLADCVFLDLYAGSGAVGIEALSRGARQVYFAESDRKAARAIRDNLKSLRTEEAAELHEREVIAALRLLDAQAVRADIIFLDPPYDHHGAYEQVLSFLAASRLLHAGTIIVAEHDKHFDPGDSIATLTRYRTLKQGDAVLSFYRTGT